MYSDWLALLARPSSALLDWLMHQLAVLTAALLARSPMRSNPNPAPGRKCAVIVPSFPRTEYYLEPQIHSWPFLALVPVDWGSDSSAPQN